MSDANELCYTSATDALHRFRTGSLSPVELTRALITRSEAVNPQINAYTYTFYDRALEAAKQAEARYGNGTNRPPEGITLVVKDSNAVAGEVTTYGSKIYLITHEPQPALGGDRALAEFAVRPTRGAGSWRRDRIFG